MALNQKERFLAGIEFDRECFTERCSSDKVEGFGDEKGELYDHKGGKVDGGFDDITDLLPPDPFNMEINTKGKGVADITGFLEDFGLNKLGLKVDEAEVSGVGGRLFEDIDFVVTGTMRIHQDAGLKLIDGNGELFGVSFKEGLDDVHGGIKDHCDRDGGTLSDALLLALGYLSLGDLLTVEGVCKSLRDVVRGDPLLWKNIHIDCNDPPYSPKITDDILIKLTNRAQGHLHSLSLYYCSKITDVGLMHVLERNPGLTKLSVPGCVRLTIDGILSNLKVLKTAGKTRLKYLGINGLDGVTNQHIEEIELLIGVDNNSNLKTTRKPRFFGGPQSRVTSDDDRVVDIEVCPKCQKLKLVYDCPLESCQKKQSATQLCRGCTRCIERCIRCGCCLDNCDYEELLSFEFLCLDCWRQPLGCQEREPILTFMSKTTDVQNQVGYYFYPQGLDA